MTNAPTPERPAPSLRTPDSDDFPSGPAVGERLPAFALRDQHGRTVSLEAARDGGRALVVFMRSAEW